MLLAIASIVASGTAFPCTPTRVWDGDGPIHCAEGPKVRLAGKATREVRWTGSAMVDSGCNRGHPCPALAVWLRGITWHGCSRLNLLVRTFHLPATLPSTAPVSPAPRPTAILQVARHLAAMRALREGALPADVSNGRPWDLLLVLYAQGELISSHAFKAAGVPHTSGLRWLDRLEELGLTRRRCPPDNFKAAYVSLTDEGLRRMTELLGQIAALP